MAELRTADPPIAQPAVADPEGDPFQRLHKMSITAGLGSGDYVAISGTAIAAVLLGIASVVVLVHTAFLLLVPLAAAVCAVAAWVQIGRSNGTLTGRGLAVLGLLLALGLGGYEGGQRLRDAITVRSARQQVVAMIHDFGQDIVHEQYAQAYQMCNDDFRAAVTLDAFEGRWQAVRHSPTFGDLAGIDWNGLLSMEIDPVSGDPTAGGMVLITYVNSPAVNRTDMFFRKDDKGWGIDRIPQLFAPATSAPKAGGVYGPPKPV